jgi:hypothetical protein
MRLCSRPQCLQQKVPDPRCLSDLHRPDPCMLVEAELRADSSVVLRDNEPEVCGLCGVVAKDVVKVILSVVEAPN